MPNSSNSALDAERPDPRFWGPVDPAEPQPGYPMRPAAWGGPLERLLDRLRDWRGDARFGIAALLVMALIAGVVWYRLGASSPAPDTAATSPKATPATSPAAPATTSKGPDEVTVHVAGAVVSPGVYELPGSARVIDAVEAAGGGAPESDLDRLNLASKLADGQRVLVQKTGDPSAPAPAGTGEAATPGDAGATGDPGAGPVNLNSATQAQLETLPGIGPVLAQAIIAERDRRSGFRSVNELRSVRGIGDKRFADLQSLVTV